jgi:GR25 family glycosyltransferase involved in LPS biosynthesis
LAFMLPIVFVINLENRRDRWEHVEKELRRLQLSAARIDAVSVPSNTEYFTKPNVAACWESHKKALRTFLDSGDSFALILEDDFKFNSQYWDRNITELLDKKIDFLQIGFLYTSLREFAYIKMENTFDLAVRTYGVIEEVLRKKSKSEKNLVNERKGLPYKIILSDIRPGAHAYIVNRRAAEYLLVLNTPTFLSTDDLFMALGPMRHIRMGRLRKTIVDQIQSISSINPR